MKITSSIVSIPPYISARWNDVTSVRKTAEDVIEISLANGTIVPISGLSKETVEQIFSCHLESMEIQKTPGEEEEEKYPASSDAISQPSIRQEDMAKLVHLVQSGIKEIMALILKLGSTAISSMGKALEHDPNNANLPPLSEEMKEKVVMLLNIVPKDDILSMPAPEAECNCMYCQINRILRKAIAQKDEEPNKTDSNTSHDGDEAVDERELEFSEWTVTPISDKLFVVRNKLDQHEEYRVFLGNPIGCTCGKANCEHIVAVLRS